MVQLAGVLDVAIGNNFQAETESALHAFLSIYILL
jgi:hypothetical protein